VTAERVTRQPDEGGQFSRALTWASVLSLLHEGENGSAAADCGTLAVPEEPGADSGPLLALPVTRVRARSDAPREPIFFLTGGPGQPNLGSLLGMSQDRSVRHRAAAPSSSGRPPSKVPHSGVAR
jgi:hypothetical protein